MIYELWSLEHGTLIPRGKTRDPDEAERYIEENPALVCTVENEVSTSDAYYDALIEQSRNYVYDLQRWDQDGQRFACVCLYTSLESAQTAQKDADAPYGLAHPRRWYPLNGGEWRTTDGAWYVNKREVML